MIMIITCKKIFITVTFILQQDAKIYFSKKKTAHFTISLNRLLKDYHYKTSSTKETIERCIKKI